MKKNIIFCIIALMLLTLVMGCGKAATQTEPPKIPGKMIVAVSIVPQATFVKAVAGDLVDVITLIPPGKSPTNYAPAPQEIEKFSKASLYFTIGVPTENANILPKVSSINKNIKIVSLSDSAAKLYKEKEISPGARDPHIWLSPKRVKVMIKTIAEELSSTDPKNKEIYNKNANSYIEKLTQADQNVQKALRKIKNKTVLVYHPAFGYFCDDYGLKMIALEEEGKEATPKDLAKKIDLAKKENIKVIFYQAEIDSKQSKSFAEELGGKTVQIEPLAENYIENLSKIAKTFSTVLE